MRSQMQSSCSLHAVFTINPSKDLNLAWGHLLLKTIFGQNVKGNVDIEEFLQKVDEDRTIASNVRLSKNKAMVPRSRENQLRASKLEQMIFDKIIKKVFGSHDSKQKLMYINMEIAAKCMNIIISRCGLQGSVGIGSLRYEIFQLVSDFDREISGRLSASIREKTVSYFKCKNLTMLGNPMKRISNLDILPYDAVASFEVLCAFYEAKDDAPSVPCNFVADFHSSVIFWISISSETIKDYTLLCRISNAFEIFG